MEVLSAISGGLFIVPTFAAVQAWAGADRRARVIAAVTFIATNLVVGGAVFYAVGRLTGAHRMPADPGTTPRS